MLHLAEWVGKLRHLRVDRSHGTPAPHKPLLLLSVIDLVEDGLITRPLVELSPELIELFSMYWEALGTSGRGLIALPFFHLRTEGFWQLLPLSGMEAGVDVSGSVSSVSRLRRLIIGASLNPEFWALLQDGEAREALRQALLSTYFAQGDDEKLAAVERHLGEVAAERKELIAKVRRDFQLHDREAKQVDDSVRSAAFRSMVQRLYEHTCAMCGLRLIGPQGSSIMEAAHIVPFSVSRNNDPRNGLGLCRVHHWCFDQGLLAVSDHLTIISSPLLSDSRPTEDRLLTLAGQRILTPEDHLYLPAADALRWHRENIFAASD